MCVCVCVFVRVLTKHVHVLLIPSMYYRNGLNIDLPAGDRNKDYQPIRDQSTISVTVTTTDVTAVKHYFLVGSRCLGNAEKQ